MYLHLLNVDEIVETDDVVYDIYYLAEVFMLLFSFSQFDFMNCELKFIRRVNVKINCNDACSEFLNCLRLLQAVRFNS